MSISTCDTLYSVTKECLSLLAVSSTGVWNYTRRRRILASTTRAPARRTLVAGRHRACPVPPHHHHLRACEPRDQGLTRVEAGERVSHTLLLIKTVIHSRIEAQPLLHALSGAKALSGTLSGPAFPGDGATCSRSPLGFWRDDGQSPSALAELRTQKIRNSVNLARAVRISGDRGQEGRHLAKTKGLRG